MFGKYEPLRRPVFAPDQKLELRQAMQRDLIGDRPVKPLIESQPDTLVRPIDYDDMPV
jgi:hypothetical protein